MVMYSFVTFREATFCGVPSCVFDKFGCATGEMKKRLRNTDLDDGQSSKEQFYTPIYTPHVVCLVCHRFHISLQNTSGLRETSSTLNPFLPRVQLTYSLQFIYWGPLRTSTECSSSLQTRKIVLAEDKCQRIYMYCISVDGISIAEYPQRSSLHIVKALHIQGDLSVINIILREDWCETAQ
jgi:hypothetical protein